MPGVLCEKATRSTFRSCNIKQIFVTTCTLYYPGLLGPEVPLDELPRGEWRAANELTHLAQLFSHAHIQPLRRCSSEARMLYGMGIGFAVDQDVPVAALRAVQLPQLQGDQPLWCLDPVCIRIDQDQAVLLGNDMLDLSESEARHLIEDLNAHLAQDGLRLHYLAPHQWLLAGSFALTTRTPGDALLANVNQYQPAGPDAARWRRLLNEIQMLLHTHEVNLQREQRGELPVNSVWLWGGGRDFACEKIVDVVYSDESLVHDAALVCDIPHFLLPDDVPAVLPRATHSLFIFTEQVRAIKNRDVFSWFEQLIRLEQQILAPVFTLLQNNMLQTLTVYSDTLSLTLTRKQMTRWWRRSKSLDKGVLKLRHQFGC